MKSHGFARGRLGLSIWLACALGACAAFFRVLAPLALSALPGGLGAPRSPSQSKRSRKIGSGFVKDFFGKGKEGRPTKPQYALPEANVFRWRLELMVAFIQEHHRLPRYRKDEQLPGERTLLNWLSTKKLEHRQLRLKDAEEQALVLAHPLLAQRVEEWDDDRANYRNENAWLDDMQEFVRDHDRMPCPASGTKNAKDDRSDKEAGLFTWFRSVCDRRRGMRLEVMTELRAMHPSIATYLDNLDRHTNSTYLDQFEEKVANLTEFMRRVGYMPKVMSVKPQERGFAMWLSALRTKELQNLSAERLDALRNVHPLMNRRVGQWMRGRKPWKEWVAAFETFVVEYDDVPRISAEDEHEKTLAGWIVRQKLQWKILPEDKRKELTSISPLVAEMFDLWRARQENLLAPPAQLGQLGRGPAELGGDHTPQLGRG